MFYGGADIGHTTLDKLIYFNDKENKRISEEVILKIIIFLGTSYDESRRLLNYYSKADVDGSTKRAICLKSLITWISDNASSFDHYDRLAFAKEFLDKEKVGIAINTKILE